jgi:hypothetical protein
MAHSYGGTIRIMGGAVVVAGLAVTLLATAASAKENLSFSVTPHSVKAGQRVHAVVAGGSDAGQAEQLCLDIRPGNGRWATVRCISDPFGAGGPLSDNYQLRRAGTDSFRGQLLVKEGRTYHVELTSGTITVRVRS